MRYRSRIIAVLDEHGNMWGSVDRRILELSSKNNVKVMPLVVNPGFDQPSFHALLHDSAARARGVSNMVRVCRENKYYGLQFDFENIHISDKDAFTDFYRQAAAALHSNGYAISVAVVPRSSEDIGPTEFHKWIYEYWRGVFDYKALAEIGDFISLMTYEQHTHRTTPGPVAGVPWMEAIIQFVMKGVPPGKISLGIPFYSRVWQPEYQNNAAHAWGKSLDYAEAMALAERNNATWKWDDREKVSYAVYPNEFLNEYIYLEDARSMAAKLALVKKYHFRGISVWRLGHEDPHVWEQINPVK
ncbi:MAG: glycosyl hydrolase family 18 protein [Ignavibacteriales bacterium]|nr:glycosyl hydrolase family 18 protein [Ignavibacteriales bacterium]